MFHPDAFMPFPVHYMRFMGALAERQLRLMTVLTRAACQPNPFLVAMAEMQALNALENDPVGEPPAKPKLVPAPKPRAGRAKDNGASRARRQPSTPPAMPV